MKYLDQLYAYIATTMWTTDEKIMIIIAIAIAIAGAGAFGMVNIVTEERSCENDKC